MCIFSLTILKKICFKIVRKRVSWIRILLGLYIWKLCIKWIWIFGKFMIKSGMNLAIKISLNVLYLRIVRRWCFICIWKHSRVVLIYCKLIYKQRGGCSCVSLGYWIKDHLLLWRPIWKWDISCLMSSMRGLIE